MSFQIFVKVFDFKDHPIKFENNIKNTMKNSKKEYDDLNYTRKCYIRFWIHFNKKGYTSAERGGKLPLYRSSQRRKAFPL